MTGTVGTRGVRGGALLLGAGALQLVIAVGSTMWLARLLTPADFGLFAMAMVGFALVAPVRDFGLPETLVQSPVLHAAGLRRLRRLNLAGTLVVGLAALGLGAALAGFYAEPRVAGLGAWLALALVLRGLANVRFGLLQRDMAWGTIAASDLLSYVLGTVVACVLALRGAGAFALVAQQLAWFGAQAALLGALGRRSDGVGVARDGSGDGARDGPGDSSGDGPGGADPRDGVRHHIGFAGSVSVTRLLTEGVAQLDRLVVGRVADVATLGLYQNALRWASLPMLQLLLPAKAIAVSTLARLADDPPRLRVAVREIYALVASLLLPMLVFVVLAAGQIVPLLLGDQWSAAIPLFRLLALAALFESMDRMAHWPHLACGHVRARLRWVLATSPVVAAAVVLGGVADGVVGVAVALLAVRALLAVPSLAWATRGTALAPRDLLSPWWRPGVATAAAATAWSGVHRVIAHRGDVHREIASGGAGGGTVPDGIAVMAVELAAGAGLFGAVYVLAWLCLPGGRALALRALAAVRTRRVGPSGPRATVERSAGRSRQRSDGRKR